MAWVVLGLKRATERVEGGAQLVRRCDGCHEETTFYEKEIKSTFRLYFIDVFDFNRDRVMACGACGAAFVTDELASKPRPQAPAESFGEQLERGGQAGAPSPGPRAPAEGSEKQPGRGGQAVSRPAADFGESMGAVSTEVGRGLRTGAADMAAGLSDIAARVSGKRVGDLARRTLGRRESASPEPDLSPEELEALRELDGPSALELRFRELERQAKARRDE